MAGNPNGSGDNGGKEGSSSGGQRHLSAASLADYLASDGPAVVKIDGNPLVYLVINPLGPKLSIRTPASKNTLPNVAAYQNISSSTQYWREQQWCEVAIQGAAVETAYALVCDIADRIQLESNEFSIAVFGALAALESLLAAKSSLSLEKQTGLFGELIVLQSLVQSLSGGEALSSWRGGDNEEHDFGFKDIDLEVKSTVTEDRYHWISSVTQLAPTLKRPLWFVSIQVTLAGSGGQSLPQLVSAIEAGFSPSEVEQFRKKLRKVGWRDADAPLYDRQLRLRTRPLVLAVDEAFPALTIAHLSSASMHYHRLKQVKYVIDLNGLAASASAPTYLANLGGVDHE